VQTAARPVQTAARPVQTARPALPSERGSSADASPAPVLPARRFRTSVNTGASASPEPVPASEPIPAAPSPQAPPTEQIPSASGAGEPERPRRQRPLVAAGRERPLVAAGRERPGGQVARPLVRAAASALPAVAPAASNASEELDPAEGRNAGGPDANGARRSIHRVDRRAP
ncbi:MAG: hypothetical protein ACRDY2_06150, partial [Acidimicrobiales bacterium]